MEHDTRDDVAARLSRVPEPAREIARDELNLRVASGEAVVTAQETAYMEAVMWAMERVPYDRSGFACCRGWEARNEPAPRLPSAAAAAAPVDPRPDAVDAVIGLALLTTPDRSTE